MAKKVKCVECIEHLNWALPSNITRKNISYAKHCINVAKRSFVCGYTGKVKSINNEQYCKHFAKTVYDNRYEKSIKELEIKIKEFEKSVEVEK